MRRRIEYQLEDVLLPGALTSGSADDERPYSIALGMPLADYPVIAAALNLLALPCGVSAGAIGGILRSPFQENFEAESIALAGLDARLRRYGSVRLDAASLLDVARRDGGMRGCPSFLLRLQVLADAFRSAPRTRSAHEWAAAFSRLLRDCGWPGDRPLNSREFQCLHAWHEALREFSSLDIFRSALAYRAALERLRQIVKQQSFQPQTGPAQLHVLGFQGAAFMEFEELWILGMDEETWPPSARPNPFLPVRLQRDLAMPHASADVQLAHARAVTGRIIGSAASVVVSFPRNEGDRPLRPSPVIAELEFSGGAPPVPGLPGCADRMFAPGSLESFIDEQAPAVARGEQTRGGTQVIGDQAACPFRSFARHRLGARGRDSIDPGISRMDRGALVHRVMQLIWESLRDQKTLLAEPAAGIERLVVRVVDTAMVSVLGRRHPALGLRFAELERARLRKIAHDWLALEKLRRDFSVIGCEIERRVELGGLAIDARIDRIDEVGGNEWIILDYKTGDATVAAWFGERPEDPQLPFYAVALDHALAGIAFARVRTGLPAFEGLAVADDVLPGVKSLSEARRTRDFDTLEELLEYWRTRLAALARGFRGGDARVDPKAPHVCRLCDLHALCRINEFDEALGGYEDD